MSANTRIEGPEDLDGSTWSGSFCNTANPRYDCSRPYWVEIDYDSTSAAPTAACPLHVRDSVGRSMDFSVDQTRHVVTAVELPSPAAMPRPTYELLYNYSTPTLTRPRPTLRDPRCYVVFGSHCDAYSRFSSERDALTSVLYPVHATAKRFQVDLDWAGGDRNGDGTADVPDADGFVNQWNYGHITSRTLPYVAPGNHATVKYKFRYIIYPEDQSSRVEVTKKRITTAEGEDLWWWYQRPDDDNDQLNYGSPDLGEQVFRAVEATNPGLVRMWDPFNNLTEYTFLNQWVQVGEVNDPGGNQVAAGCYYAGPEHTECPSFWYAGLLKTVRVYQGCQPDPGHLVRETNYAYEPDLDANGTVRLFQYRKAISQHPDVYRVGRNIRGHKQSTRILDVALAPGGPPEVTVEQDGWDGMGLFAAREN